MHGKLKPPQAWIEPAAHPTDRSLEDEMDSIQKTIMVKPTSSAAN